MRGTLRGLQAPMTMGAPHGRTPDDLFLAKGREPRQIRPPEMGALFCLRIDVTEDYSQNDYKVLKGGPETG